MSFVPMEYGDINIMKVEQNLKLEFTFSINV